MRIWIIDLLKMAMLEDPSALMRKYGLGEGSFKRLQENLRRGDWKVLPHPLEGTGREQKEVA